MICWKCSWAALLDAVVSCFRAIMKVKAATFYHKRELMRNKESTLPGLIGIIMMTYLEHIIEIVETL